MAFRRSVAARARLFYQQQQQRVALPLSRIDRDDNDRRRQDLPIYDLCRGGNAASFSFSGSRNLFGDRRFAVPAAYAPVFVRNSSSSVGEGRGAKIMNEATAAAMNASQVDALQLQYLTDYIDTLTRFDWCASIAVTTVLYTVLIHTLHLPSTMRQIKTISIMLKIEEELKRNDMSPDAMAARMCELFNEYKRCNYRVWFAYTLFVVPFFCTVMFSMALMVGAIALWITHLIASVVISILPSLTVITLSAMEALFFIFITSKLCGFAVIIAMTTPRGRKMLGLPSLDNMKVTWRWVGWGK